MNFFVHPFDYYEIPEHEYILTLSKFGDGFNRILDNRGYIFVKEWWIAVAFNISILWSLKNFHDMSSQHKLILKKFWIVTNLI